MDDKAIIQAAYEDALGKIFQVAFANYRVETETAAMDGFKDAYLLLMEVRDAALAIIHEFNADAGSPA